MTPGIAVVGAGVAGSGGSWVSPSVRRMLSRLRTFGLVVHFASAALKPGFCHACSPVPRLKDEEGLWAEAAAAVQPTSTARASVDFMVIPQCSVVALSRPLARFARNSSDMIVIEIADGQRP